jgi:hypothetical protein
VIREAGADEAKQLDRLYQILFARTPDSSEKAILRAFLDRHRATITEKASDGKFAVALPIGFKEVPAQDPVRASALVDLVHTVVNSNHFIYRF